MFRFNGAIKENLEEFSTKLVLQQILKELL